jgi:isobutyryl-CoA mutase
MEKLRFVTATSLFDGHDVSINIMRRLLQSKGVEVIHLGHNRSAREVFTAAIHEDAHAVAISSYQGGHMEYFTYIREMLDEAGAENIRIFGGGGGVITPGESKELHEKGVTRIYSPEDGMTMGLVGIVDDMINKAEWNTTEGIDFDNIESDELSHYQISKVISHIENHHEVPSFAADKELPVLGITGTGGAGKSSLIDEILLRIHRYFPEMKIALVSVDPTRRKTQGALLGDRIRLGAAVYEKFYIRSLATRESKTELSPGIKGVVDFLKTQDFNLIMVETSGIGQASDSITEVADHCLYVMTPEFGAQTQLEKIEMLEAADMIVINKFEKTRGEDALNDVRKQYRRNHEEFSGHPGAREDHELPIYGTIASQFNDAGVNALFADICGALKISAPKMVEMKCEKVPAIRAKIIPPERALYLRDIVETVRNYNTQINENAKKLFEFEALCKTSELLPGNNEITAAMEDRRGKIDPDVFEDIKCFDETVEQYDSGTFRYTVRDKEFKVPTKYTSVARQSVSKVASPKFSTLHDKYKFIKTQNLPGFFPFGAGVFPFKRSDEEPKRMFAGEGGPDRTNKRFHYLSKDDPAKRLSTAFDSVTLYGEDPDERPDIFGKIGEAGVSVATLDDMKVLYSGFDLTSPNTSVSMTINGPAPVMLAMFMNTAMDQALEGEDYWNAEKRIEVMRQVRGTVQADILKEDQAQNTCILSLDFALKLMGDMQEFFAKSEIKNYYTVSVSGYHIAEAGANPISQMAFTIANGFTLVEYYLSRGMKIDEICNNISFFFSNGLDPEYAVMGRVARKIWAVAMKERYGASSKSQRFKYHCQTSGRSLHAQEINFNDIRTTLQAFLALSDNANSLHTNAYDEAITTPTEESVRRAMAIQMIINREFGINQTDNPVQGAYLYEELSEIVEEAVLNEFERISDRGGVLGAMESMYQRSKIQEESLYYETMKDNGTLPIIGVNTYIADNIADQMKKEIDLTRATYEEKMDQINRLAAFKSKNRDMSGEALIKLREVSLDGGNVFEELLSTVNYCSLGEIISVLYEVGGRYRRNM